MVGKGFHAKGIRGGSEVITITNKPIHRMDCSYKVSKLLVRYSSEVNEREIHAN